MLGLKYSYENSDRQVLKSARLDRVVRRQAIRPMNKGKSQARNLWKKSRERDKGTRFSKRNGMAF